nr:hypothetical protein [Tanacetum cinerariifolium]
LVWRVVCRSRGLSEMEEGVAGSEEERMAGKQA